jgi:hypothetical protein
MRGRSRHARPGACAKVVENRAVSHGARPVSLDAPRRGRRLDSCDGAWRPGAPVGRVETFATLLAQAPQTDVGFWRAWYFGRIPWQRETVTPASVMRTQGLRPVFDGVATG